MNHGRARWAGTVLFLFTLVVFPGSMLTGAPAFSRAEIINRVVAVVNDQVVTLYELDNRMRVVIGKDPAELASEDQKAYFETRHQVLELLMEEKITQQKIKELGIRVGDEELDAYIEKLKKDNNLTQEDFILLLQERGISLEAYRDALRKEFERHRLISQEIQSKIIIREEQVKEYFQAHRDKFRTDDKVHLAAIVLRVEDPDKEASVGKTVQTAREILARLKKGEDFGALAKEFSEGPGAREGGDLGFFKLARLDPELIKVIDPLEEGGVSQPILRGPTVQIVKVLEKQTAGSKEYEQVRGAIQDTLYREEVERHYNAWIKVQREKAYTKIIF